MRNPDPNCKICGGEGTITVDYNDPSDYHGHGQYESPCECTDEDYEQDEDIDLGGGSTPVRPINPEPDLGGGGAEAKPEKKPVPSPIKLPETKNV